MKRKKESLQGPVILVAFAIVAVLGIVAYFVVTENSKKVETNQSQKNSALLYFVDSTGAELKPEQMEITSTEKTDIISEVLGKLVDGPKTTGLSLSIPSDVIMDKVTLTDDVLEVNVTGEYNSLSPKDQLLLRSSIAKTLTGLEFVSSVKLLVDGEEIISPNGDTVGEIRDVDIVSNEVVSPEPKDIEKTIDLYFARADEMGLSLEQRTVLINPNQSLAKVVVEQLIAGPTKEGLISTVPAETVIGAVEIIEGICYVDLSAEFETKQSGGSSSEQLTVYSIVNSLTMLKEEGGITKVQFFIEGKTKTEYKGHLDLSKPFDPMPELIIE